MEFKGETTIQLFDATSGRLVEEHHDTNMVTHAVRDLLAMDPLGMRNLATMNSNFPVMPLCPNAIGGVLLFPSTLTEDADQYYAPPSNVPTGYAAAESYTGSDPKRGQYNASESAKLSNGYRFVFDFPTDRGNGTISAVSLTSLLGARRYTGSNYDSGSDTSYWYKNLAAGTGGAYSDSSTLPGGWQNDVLYAASVTGQTTTQSGTPTTTPVKWTTRTLHASTLGLNQTAKDENDPSSSTITLNANYYQAWSGGKQYADSGWDHDKFYVWAYAGNSSGSASIKLATINAGTLAERTLTVAAQLAGYDTGTLLGRAAVSNGYLYAFNHALTGIYRINLSDESDVTLITPLDSSGYVPSGRPGLLYNPYGDGTLITYLLNSTSYVKIIRGTTCENLGANDYRGYLIGYDSFPSIGRSAPVHSWGPYQLWANSYSPYNGLYLFVRTPYLATINNLSTPVTKTSDRTMKVTYTITEA